MTPLRWAALAVFVSLPVFSYFVQPLAGRVVWTLVIAGVPLFIVLAGYHRWRRICPLAFFAQLPTRLGKPGRRRASRSFQAHYYYVPLAIFFFSLWLRLIATNGNGPAIALFLILLSLAALAVGATYTGKTWCNYVCPVSFIEKIYTEPRGLRDTPNSQCEICTACKPACPDINEENGYWREVGSRSKRFAYFAFPGLVFSFYFYYYLQAGTWDYYFGGRWTNQPGVFGSAFFPGHDAETAGLFFFPAAPRALAAALALALGALLSFGLFVALERRLGGWLRQRALGMKEADVRHRMFTVAAFTAFVTFYTFAGAPTIRKLPGAPHFFQILVVATATFFLARRLRRDQKSFTEETLARQIIRRWPWTDTKPPEDLREAFLIHTIRSESRSTGYAQLLDIYREAVREVVATGFATRTEVGRLESLRNQLQIQAADHEKIMAELEEEERARINDPTQQLSAEKRLQLETYGRALANYLERVSAAEGAPDQSFIEQRRLDYGVTPEEHAFVYGRLLGTEEALAGRLVDALRTIEGTARAIHALAAGTSPSGGFLAEILRCRRERALNVLLRTLQVAPEKPSQPVREGLLSADPAARASAVEALAASVAPSLAERLLEAFRSAACAEEDAAVSGQPGAWRGLGPWLRTQLTSGDPYLRAAALYHLAHRAEADEETLRRMASDEHSLVRETAFALRTRRESERAPRSEINRLEPTTLELIIALRSVPIFSSLGPEELAELAFACAEKEFAPGEALCVEGQPGDEVFVLMAGEVKVLRREGGQERMVMVENAGGFIGEMAVLDPAPRAATVIAGEGGTHALVLDGETFRAALRTNPAVAESVIRTLARRLRGGGGHHKDTKAPRHAGA